MIAPPAARLLPLLAALCAPALLACGSPVVGADCAPGFSLCGERCVDLQRDPDHCGACDESCGRLQCRDAECGPGLRPDTDGGSDGGVLVIDDGLPFLPDGGFDFPDLEVGRGCRLGQSVCGELCTDLANDWTNCGECGVVCPPEQYCHAGECMNCSEPLRVCNGGCASLQNDARNCGSCNHVCRSGICEGGACADLLTGHLVILGHDYSGGRPSATALRLVGNAVFLASGSPVRTLVYEGTATDDSIAGVTTAIDYVVAKDGRDWAPMSVAAGDIGAELRSADALLVHAQSGSSNSQLVRLGRRVGLALTQFLARGGVIVVIESPSTRNAGTFKLLVPAGLFDADEREQVTSPALEVVAAGVGVAARTTRTYRSPTPTVRFLGVTSPGTPVVRDRDGETVVFHRIVTP